MAAVRTSAVADVDACNYCSLSTHRPAVITVRFPRLLTDRTLANTDGRILHIAALYGSAHKQDFSERVVTIQKLSLDWRKHHYKENS